MSEWVSTGKVASGTQYHDFPPGTLEPGAGEWQVRAWDSSDAPSDWSAVRTFGINHPPVATGLSIADAAQGTPAAASWTYSDADGNPQARYQLRHRVAGSTPAYPGAVMALDPLRYYRFTEGGGTVAVAEVGADGTYVGSGTVGGSPVPGASGRDGGYTTVPNWTKPQALTINCWFRCDPGELDNNTSYRTLWGFGNNNWDARFDTKRSVTMHVYAADSSWGSTSGISVGFDLDDGQWHMLTLVWDGINGQNRSYLDGVLNRSASFTPQMPRAHTGAFGIGATASGSRLWAGEYAEASIHDRALTGAEVADLYAVVGDVATPTWTALPEVTSATHAGTIDTTGLDLGAHEAAVRVSDGTDWSEWSDPAPFEVLAPNARANFRIGGEFVALPVLDRIGGQFIARPGEARQVRQGGQWVGG